MRYGSLCSGIGGLDLAVEAVFDVTPAWFCEADKHAASVLRRWWPNVPVLSNIKTQDWTQVESVELVSAGYPCQPFSQAGKRGGAGDPRHLWPFVIAAIRVLRPRFVVLENVSGHLSLGFDRVLADLAEAGFDAEWAVVPASAAGACHRRERLFVVGTPNAHGDRLSIESQHDSDAPPATAERVEGPGHADRRDHEVAPDPERQPVRSRGHGRAVGTEREREIGTATGSASRCRCGLDSCRHLGPPTPMGGAAR